MKWVPNHETVHNMKWDWLKVQIKLIIYIVNLVHDFSEIGRTYGYIDL